MTQTSGLGAMGLGPIPGVAETMEFVRRAWSSFNLPSSMAPTLDLEEIDKRISDLKTVEQWLSMNLSLLQSAIQGLEIQRGTIAALKAFGDAVGTPAGMDPASAAAKAMAAVASMTAGQSAKASEAASASPGDAASDRPGTSASATVEAPSEGSTATPAGFPFGQPGSEAINPAAWWSLLQSQFNQVAQAALAGAAEAAATAGAATQHATAAAETVTRPARRTAARKPAARTSSASAATSGKGGTRGRKAPG